jgi:hypothetical protein
MTYHVMVCLFSTWDLHVQIKFIKFMPFINKKFPNLATLTFDQWCIFYDFGTSSNQFCCHQCFVGFFKKAHQGFFLSTYAKNCIFLWHHLLNQHIDIDIMYPSSMIHFNTMIFIPLCENCKFCTYWYHLVWVFLFSPQYLYCHNIWISKKSNTLTKWVC